MLLSTPDRIDHHSSSGLWGQERLDQIFARHAQTRGDDLALVDDQALGNISGREPQCLSFLQAWKQVLTLSGFLKGIGVKPDTVVAMMLPPCVDAAILALVASRMGLILAPLPLTSGEAEIRSKLEQTGAKAIICCAHFENEPIGERVRNVAADLFSIRFVFCVGQGAPEGLIELDAMLADGELADEALFDADINIDANNVLAIHWKSAGRDEAVALGRSHNELLSVARHAAEHLDLLANDCVMISHHLSGLVGFAAGLVAGLDSGARIQFHSFRSVKGFVEALAEFGVEHVSLPGALWLPVHEKLPVAVREKLKSVALVWNRSHSREYACGENETAARLLDLTNFNDLALVMQIRRHPGEIGSIPLGQIASLHHKDANWMETHLAGLEEARARADQSILGGELCIKGSMIPQCAFPVAGAFEGAPIPTTSQGFAHTGIACHLVTEEHGDQRAMFRPLEELGDVLTIGAFSERGADLDALYKSCEGVVDAAAFLLPPKDGGPEQLMAALVVKDKDIGRDLFYKSLAGKSVSKVKWPKDILLVEAIPRKINGSVQRDSLIEAGQIANVA